MDSVIAIGKTLGSDSVAIVTDIVSAFTEALESTRWLSAVTTESIPILDMRSKEEYYRGHFNLSVHITVDELVDGDRWAELPRRQSPFLILISTTSSHNYFFDSSKCKSVQRSFTNLTGSLPHNSVQDPKESPELNSNIVSLRPLCKSVLEFFQRRQWLNVEVIGISNISLLSIFPTITLATGPPVISANHILWSPSPTLQRYHTSCFLTSSHYSFSPLSQLSSPVSNSYRGIALDLGCGSGRDTCFLGFLGYFVVAVDSREDALRRTHLLLKRHNIDHRSIRIHATVKNEKDFQSLVCDAIHQYQKHLNFYKKNSFLQKDDFKECLTSDGKKHHHLKDSSFEVNLNECNYQLFDFINVSRFLVRLLLPILFSAVRPNGFIAYSSFIEGCVHPSREHQVLKVGELHNYCVDKKNWKTVYDDIIFNDDRTKQLSNFLAQRKTE